jgi:multidrug resistance efflux pump
MHRCKTLWLLAMAVSTLSSCDERPTPPPASVSDGWTKELSDFEADVARQKAALAEQLRRLDALPQDAGLELGSVRKRLTEEELELRRTAKLLVTVDELITRAGKDPVALDAARADVRTRMTEARSRLSLLRKDSEASWVQLQQDLARLAATSSEHPKEPTSDKEAE